MRLTEKQKRFIDYYVQTGNATEACKKAGYKGKNLNVVGAENLTKLNIYIQEKLAKKEEKRIAKQDEILQYLTSVMRGEQREEVVVVEGNGDGCLSATTVDKGANIKDRIKAAELLGKRYGSWIAQSEKDEALDKLDKILEQTKKLTSDG